MKMGLNRIRPELPVGVLLYGLAFVVLTTGAVWGQTAETPVLDTLIAPDGAGGGTAFQPGVTVASRARPEYDASGIHLGNFVIRPQVTEGVGYESNVLGSSRARGSILWETNASLDAVVDSDATNLGASLTVDDNHYLDLPKQSFTDWSVSLGGSHEFGRDIATAGYTHQALTQTSVGLDTPQLDQALPYTIDTAQFGYRANFARSYVTPAIQISDYNFSNGAVAGAPYIQNYRDHFVMAPSLTAGYELSPRRNIVFVIRNSEANYSHRLVGLAARNYNDTAVLAGIDYDADSVIRYRALVGYEIRKFSSSQYKTIQAPIAELSAIWTPTGLTTVTGTVARRIEDSADETVAGYTETYVQFRLDHEYLPNVLFRGTAGAYFTDYASGGGNQALYAAGFGLTYLMNRNMQLSGSYDFLARASMGSAAVGQNGQVFGGSYVDHRITLQLRIAL